MHESSLITTASDDQVRARRELFSLLKSYPATEEETERSLGLFLRGSLLARLLATFEIYRQIVPIPGAIMDMGTWRGQSAVLCENFRAILEPLNFQRRIHAFDTFTGYAGFADGDSRIKSAFSDGTYALPDSYAELLAQLLQIHERNNALGHMHGKHRVWAGDCRETLKSFEQEFPGETIALAWFDMNAYAPTEAAFQVIRKRLVPGAIVAFWQMTRAELSAEGAHYLQAIRSQIPHTLHHSPLYPSLCYLVCQ
ncbi:MAG: class I SAM-dependent methyltransferase [Paludibacter sp.]